MQRLRAAPLRARVGRLICVAETRPCKLKFAAHAVREDISQSVQHLNRRGLAVVSYLSTAHDSVPFAAAPFHSKRHAERGIFLGQNDLVAEYALRYPAAYREVTQRRCGKGLPYRASAAARHPNQSDCARVGAVIEPVLGLIGEICLLRILSPGRDRAARCKVEPYIV